ncbi:MAG: T9SS type A sorting domain-containing protein [Bacteroidota bacterium]
MKQRLLPFVLLVLAASINAQEVIWTEDFSRGFVGWTANSLICGSNTGATYGDVSGPAFGTWTLSELILDGEPVDIAGLELEWTFINSTEYLVYSQLPASDIDIFLTAYGSYSLDEMNVMTSSIDSDEIIVDGLAFSEASTDGLVEWAVVSAGLGIDDLGYQLIGTGNPTVELTDGGNTLTYTAVDGGLIATYTKRNECGTQWVWSPNGNLGSGTFDFDTPGTVFVDSDTRANGSMVMRNIFNMFGGDAANVPNPNAPPYPHYASELISPLIDISEADRALSLSLTQFLGYLNTPQEAPDGIKTALQISTDNGATWSTAVDINPDLPADVFRSNRQTVPIPLAFTAGADEIRIKLTFATDYYFWGIDDISIQERIDYDVQANENFFAVTDNRSTPWSQLQPQYFMADIQNNGGLTAENVQLNLTITHNESGEEVYNRTKSYGDLPPDSLAENDFFAEVLDLESDHASEGTYSGQYTIFHDSLDQVTDNDTLNFTFAVTDTVFAKEAGRTRGIFLPDNRAWYIGNCFYVPDGEEWYARYMSFMVDNASEVVANDGRNSVITNLYESDGDVNGDGRISPDEYGEVPIAFNEYVFDGTEDEVLITIPVDLEEEGIPLTSGKYYLAVVQYPGINEEDNLAISASEAINYNANNFITDSIGIVQYSDVVDLTLEQPNFFSGGFGGTSVPVVRLTIGDNPDLDSHPHVPFTTTVLPEEYEIEVFPNPATENFNIELKFPDVQDVLIRFYDQAGRILTQQELDGVRQARYRYNLDETIPAGIYFLQLNTDAGTRTEKVVVQH